MFLEATSETNHSGRTLLSVRLLLAHCSTVLCEEQREAQGTKQCHSAHVIIATRYWVCVMCRALYWVLKILPGSLRESCCLRFS